MSSAACATAVPKIAALIATRNRGSSAVMAVQSILANNYPKFELLVVDQSTDDQTRQALRPFCADSRFRYLRTDTVGLGRAHNIGLAALQSDYVAITDDDCVVPADWLSKIAKIFDDNDRVVVAYCNVLPAPHDEKAGFIPDYHRTNSRLVTTLRGKITARGIGAGMAVRRQPVLQIGGFDENMGPGAKFPSAGDRDLAIRALLKGWWLYETDTTSVIHHGFRTWEEGRELTRRDWLALGAMCAKPVKCGYWQTFIYAIYESFGNGALQPFAAVLQGKRPRGFRRFIFFWQGFWQGWHTPITPDDLLFEKSEASQAKLVSKPSR